MVIARPPILQDIKAPMSWAPCNTWLYETRAATPLDCLDIECAGITARNTGLNISSQLIELRLFEAVFFFHQAQILATTSLAEE